MYQRMVLPLTFVSLSGVERTHRSIVWQEKAERC
jgi:hypothetical protein